MLRLIIHVAAALAVTCGFAGPAAAQQLWSGVLQVTDQTAGCAQSLFPTGVNMTSTYRPYLNVGDAPSAFMFMPSDNAGALLFTNLDSVAQFDGTGRYQNMSISNIATGGSFRGTYKLSQKPSVLSQRTKFVSLSGIIKNYVVSGCTLKIQAFYTARVNGR